MSVVAKDTVLGLETSVKQFQEYINSKLTWAGTNNVYGLLYPINSDSGTVLEAYIGNGLQKKEYAQVFINDTITSSIGFLEVGNRNLSSGHNATVDIICTMRLDKAYSSNDRQDERALLEFERIIVGYYAVKEIVELKLGIELVFSGFYIENIKHNDMHPWLVFSMRVVLTYKDDLNCGLSVN
jgi:hypothetical protein